MKLFIAPNKYNREISFFFYLQESRKIVFLLLKVRMRQTKPKIYRRRGVRVKVLKARRKQKQSFLF